VTRPRRCPQDPADAIAVYHPGDHRTTQDHQGIAPRNASYRRLGRFSFAYKATMGEVVFQRLPYVHSGGLMGRCIPPLASGASMLIPSVMGARDKFVFVQLLEVCRKVSRVHVSPAFNNSRGLEQESASGRESFITQALFHYWFNGRYRYRCEIASRKFPEYAY